jgi:hypothetical protein
MLKRLAVTLLLITPALALPQPTQPAFSDHPALKEYDPKPLEPKVTDDEWAKYTETLSTRGDEALKDLNLSDPAKAAHVKQSVMLYYRFLRGWHDKHDARLKELNKDAKANAAAIAEERKSLMEVHNAFVADLATVLSPAQVDSVKEYLTYKRPSIMYEGFTKDNPWLTAEQKAKIRDICNESRELAMDEGSSKDKHALMDKYKGRITNFIAAAKKAATQPASQPQ